MLMFLAIFIVPPYHLCITDFPLLAPQLNDFFYRNLILKLKFKILCLLLSYIEKTRQQNFKEKSRIQQEVKLSFCDTVSHS